MHRSKKNPAWCFSARLPPEGLWPRFEGYFASVAAYSLRNWLPSYQTVSISSPIKLRQGTDLKVSCLKTMLSSLLVDEALIKASSTARAKTWTNFRVEDPLITGLVIPSVPHICETDKYPSMEADNMETNLTGYRVTPYRKSVVYSVCLTHFAKHLNCVHGRAGGTVRDAWTSIGNRFLLFGGRGLAERWWLHRCRSFIRHLKSASCSRLLRSQKTTPAELLPSLAGLYILGKTAFSAVPNIYVLHDSVELWLRRQSKRSLPQPRLPLTRV